MLILHKIEKTHFSPNESIIIRYILDQGENIKEKSLNTLASETYTSPPLFVRIAKKLGYNGWSSFKDAYLKELDYLYRESDVDASIPFVVNNDYMAIAKHITHLEIETLEDTLNLLEHDQLYLAMRYLRDAKKIDLYGVSGHIISAQQFADKMFYINKDVNVCQLEGTATSRAIMSDASHCAILISYSGETSFIINVAKILKQKKTKIIAITSIANNTLSQIADVSLRMSSREMLQTKIADFATSQSVKCLLDILYGCIFSLDYQKNLDHKISLAKEVDDRVSGFEYINENNEL